MQRGTRLKFSTNHVRIKGKSSEADDPAGAGAQGRRETLRVRSAAQEEGRPGRCRERVDRTEDLPENQKPGEPVAGGGGQRQESGAGPPAESHGGNKASAPSPGGQCDRGAGARMLTARPRQAGAAQGSPRRLPRASQGLPGGTSRPVPTAWYERAWTVEAPALSVASQHRGVTARVSRRVTHIHQQSDVSIRKAGFNLKLRIILYYWLFLHKSYYLQDTVVIVVGLS